MQTQHNAVVEALHLAWKAAMSHGVNLMVHEIYLEQGGHCEDLILRARRALKHQSMVGSRGDPDYDDLLMVLVHADSQWIGFLLQSMANASTMIPPNRVELQAASSQLQAAAHELVVPRVSQTSPMPHYHFLHGSLMRVCHQGDVASGEAAMKSLFSILPEVRPASFADFSRVLMGTHRDAVNRGLPTATSWADAVQGAAGLGRAIRNVVAGA